MTAYYEERSAALVAAGLDPDEDDVWAQPDYVEELDNIRDDILAYMEDPWGDEEEDE